jgi:adenosylmethionine-8-amino-7-oxononanoate aminotransferase
MNENQRELDHRHLWHPYTDIEAFETGPYTSFERGEGVYLYTSDGRQLLDGISSWWATALGHSHPQVVEAIRQQAGVLQHSILGGLSHPLAVELAHRLAQLTPGDLNHVYFACDGASATESAMKMAIQYWWNLGESGKTRFVALEEGYHGDTLGAVGAGFVPAFHAPFEKAVIRSFAAKTPHCGCCPLDGENKCADKAFAHMESLVEEHHKELAGIILEPLCQGAAGVWIYPVGYLRKVRDLCDKYGLILIADEIAVGFGRMGELFACDLAGIVPDILCVGKALTAGYLPMSAAVANERVYDSFRNTDDARDRTFYDGHTYCGNPITSAAALAAIDVFTSEDVVENARPGAIALREGFQRIGANDAVDYQKTLGMIGMCSFRSEAGGGAHAKRVAQKANELGLFIRPLGTSLYLWPPLVSTEAELAQMLSVFETAVAETPVLDDAIKSGV